MDRVIAGKIKAIVVVLASLTAGVGSFAYLTGDSDRRSRFSSRARSGRAEGNPPGKLGPKIGKYAYLTNIIILC